jgi:hypothetical protein
MPTIYQPFTPEQVQMINEQQSDTNYHPLTCCSPSWIKECSRRNGNGSGGKLVANESGLSCPCGKYVETEYRIKGSVK